MFAGRRKRRSARRHVTKHMCDQCLNVAGPSVLVFNGYLLLTMVGNSEELGHITYQVPIFIHWRSSCSFHSARQ